MPPTNLPRRLARTLRYASNWINVFTDRVQLPSGRIVEEYHVVECATEAVEALIENERGEVLLVRVCRYPTQSLEWELPGGRLDPGETPLEAAHREAFEETGYETTDHAPFYVFHPTNGLSNQQFHIVRCNAAAQTGQADPDEVEEVRWFTRAELREMIERHELRCGFTLVALLLLLQNP